MGEKGTVWSNITRHNVRLRGTDFFRNFPWNSCRKCRNFPCNINKNLLFDINFVIFLGRTSTVREGCWERGDDFFHGGDAIFTHKKLKSEILNNKKSLQAKIFFSVITNNSNREILPKDLVTFKRKGGIKDEQVLIFWEFTERSDFKGGGSQKTNIEGVCLKRGDLGHLQI